MHEGYGLICYEFSGNTREARQFMVRFAWRSSDARRLGLKRIWDLFSALTLFAVTLGWL